jgi:hypothetical protein
MVDFMKKIKNIQQVCTTSTHVVESSNDVAVISVDMKFDNFVRSNYVTIANTPAAGRSPTFIVFLNKIFIS